MGGKAGKIGVWIADPFELFDFKIALSAPPSHMHAIYFLTLRPPYLILLSTFFSAMYASYAGTVPLR